MNALRCLLFFVCGWTWLALAAGQAAGQQPTGPGGADKTDTGIFRLKNMKAGEAVAILREVFREQAGPKGRLTLGTDERTNAVVVNGSPVDLLTVRALLEKLDVPGEPPAGERTELKAFPLGRIEPDEALEKALRLVLDGRGPARFVVDRQRRLVLVSGNVATLKEVQALLAQLEAPPENRGEPTVELTVRLFWLVSGLPAKDAARLPDDLKDVAADLEKQGLDKPRLAAQILVHAALGAPFEISGTAHLDAPYHLTFSGTAALKQASVGLDVTVSAERSGTARERTPVAGVHTQVTALPGRMVVLGVTPTDKLTSAFVLQVEGKKPASPGKPGTPAKPGQAGAFDFQNKPWSSVFEWLSDQTGLPVVANVKPTGTFTFVPPAGKKYTVAEMIDVVNEALQMQKYILIRGEHSLIVVPADEKIDPSLVPRVLPADLGLRGRTEMVSVVIPLRTVKADDIAPDVKKLLGPFGEVSVLKKANQLVVQDTAGNVGRVYAMIQTLEMQGDK